MYNNGMGEVDIADQLRLQYRLDKWIRNCKWWMSIFMWRLASVTTNAYVMYCKEEEVKVQKETTNTYRTSRKQNNP